MKARLRDLSVNYENGNAIASFELESLPEIIEKYRGKELEIKISQYFRRKSLNANSYYWVLCNQLAGARGMTNTEMHNFLLAEYGKFDGLEIAMRPDIDWMKLNDIHLRPTKQKEGSYDVYQVIKGSTNMTPKRCRNSSMVLSVRLTAKGSRPSLRRKKNG